MNATHQRLVAVLFLVLGFLLTMNLFAQTETASVRGQVTDPSGALIPGAIIRFTAADAKVFSGVDNFVRYLRVKESAARYLRRYRHCSRL